MGGGFDLIQFSPGSDEVSILTGTESGLCYRQMNVAYDQCSLQDI